MSFSSCTAQKIARCSARAFRLRYSPSSCSTSRSCSSRRYNCSASSNWSCKSQSPLPNSQSRLATSLSTSSSLRSQFARTRRRDFSTTAALKHGHLDPPAPGEERHVTFIDKDGGHHSFEVADGQHLMEIAQEHDLDVEGACGGSCACSTCHVIVVDEAYYDKMNEPEDDENDMLDLAFGLTETSRLGCQVQMSKELSGLVVQLPQMTRNMQASDFK